MADSAKIMDMHETIIVGKMNDMIGEVKVEITPKLRTEELSVNVWMDAYSRLKEINRSEIFLSWPHMPISMNSVLDKFKRFDVIQKEISVTTWRRLTMGWEKLFWENEVNSWVSSANRWAEDTLMFELSGLE